MAGELTAAQIWAALSTVGLVLLGWSKAWKIVFGTEFGKDVKAGFPLFMKWWYREEIRHKDLMNTIGEMKREITEVKAEVKYNGGSSMRDAVKRTEEAVKDLKGMVEHNRVLKDITDLCSDRMLFKMNGEGGCSFINDAFLKLFGYTEGDVLDYGFEDLVHEDDRHDMNLKWTKAINTKTPFKDDQRIKDCNGVWHNCLVRAFPVVVNGELKEFSGIIEITD